MDFTNSFAVEAPVSSVWEVLTDVHQVAPCVPGAQITEMHDATHYSGTVKVKLGAVQMNYRGTLEMEADEGSRTIVLRARGSETRGSGGASGTFTTTLAEGEDGLTKVDIQSHVDVTGRVAQFGRGIMQDVANRLIRDFAQCLETKVSSAPVRSEELTPASAGMQEVAASSTEAAGAQEVAASSGAAAEESVAGDDQPAAEAVPSAEPPSTVLPASVEERSAPPAYSPGPTAEPAAELRVQDLVVEVLRTRTAAGLRWLADRVEPRR